MLELSAAAGGLWRLRWGGDTLNTAVHLARLGVPTGYVTALGADPFSDTMREGWAAEGLDTRGVLRDSERLPGLYAIRTDAEGERSFHYWREASAARRMFDLPDVEAALAGAAGAEVLYFSLISLAVAGAGGRDRLVRLCEAVRARGGRVAFDSNYRPRLWNDAAEALAACERVLPLVDIGLPTLEDERALTGAANAEAVARRWRDAGVAEVVVKSGARGCLVATGEGAADVPAEAVAEPVDTSGAGDAFNGGYLAGRLAGSSPEGAARLGHALAARVIRHPGALPDRQAIGDYPCVAPSTG